jgi:hypothetical protein
MKQATNPRGLTIVEAVITLLLCGCVVSLIWANADQIAAGPNAVSWGANGPVATRCINGYKHTVGAGGQARQLLNEHGGGIRCATE